MPLPPDVKKAIEQIDQELAALTNQRIADLRRTKEMLITSYSNSSVSKAAEKERPTRTEERTISPSAQKLRVFLQTHGPASRKEILDKAGLPPGTISTALNKFRSAFKRRSDGKWEAQ